MTANQARELLPPWLGASYARVSRFGRTWRRNPPGKKSDVARTRDDSTPVFFVTGLGKSGTRWLTKILDSHPEVLCKGEGRFFSAGWMRADLDPANESALPSSLYYALTHSEHLRLWIERSVWSRDGDPDEHLNALMRLATEYFLTAELSKSGKRLVGDKSPLLDEEFIREVGTVYPGSRVIHIIRDGRDRTVSSMHRGWRRASQGLETPCGQGRRRRPGFARVGLHRGALRRPAGAPQRGSPEIARLPRSRYGGEARRALREFGELREALQGAPAGAGGY